MEKKNFADYQPKPFGYTVHTIINNIPTTGTVTGSKLVAKQNEDDGIIYGIEYLVSTKNFNESWISENRIFETAEQLYDSLTSIVESSLSLAELKANTSGLSKLNGIISKSDNWQQVVTSLGISAIVGDLKI